MNVDSPIETNPSAASPLIPTVAGEGETLIAFGELFVRQVALTPDRNAVIHGERCLTYRHLDQMATAFASKMIASGVDHGDHVGLCLDRSPEAIAAMLGVMKIGAAFVPLDPDYPLDRLLYMIEDTCIATVVAEPRHREMLQHDLSAADDSPSITWIDSRPDAVSDPLPTTKVRPDDVAYVMYTSGSTGNPKGVQIEHAALAAYCFADIEIYQVVPEDRTLQFSTLNFDIAIEEIFPPLLSGGCVVVRPSERASERNELSSIVNNFDVTALHLATAYWHGWVDLMIATGERVPSSLRLMIVTGEKVSVEHYRRWQSISDHDVLWCNAYGPTEATVSATVFIPDQHFDAPQMPIGKPMKRYEARILDDSLDEVADGETGQLYIGGPALARGYLNRPDLTDKAFVTRTGGDHSQRLYRTGDLARWLPDGNIEFAGRIDHQIKLGSYRIEPGEIEAALDRHPCVLESLVSYDDVEGQKYLIAYVATGAGTPAPSELAGFLRSRLPPYMIPARYAFMKEFPKTINGKIDRGKLDPTHSRVASDESFVTPRNEMEHRLARIWQEVLHVPQVGIHDDFFLIGGSSLLVTQVVTRLTADLNIELPVRDFFANPTVASAARHLTRLTGIETTDSDDIAQRRARLPLMVPGYFENGNHRLFAMHYQPRRQTRNHAVLMCHAAGHEYARSYRNMQQLGVQLCQAGFDVLRFDYVGSGNSTGDCDQASFDQMRSDAHAAAAYLRSLCPTAQVSALGIRLGATALATAGLEDLTNMILWDPIVDGTTFIEQLEHFHRNALYGLTRFNRRRRPGPIDQLFGHRMNQTKRDSFAGAKLPSRESIAAGRAILVSSRNYFETESHGCDVRSHWEPIMTPDEIRWHDPDYTESAFSSPHIFRVVLDSLLESNE